MNNVSLEMLILELRQNVKSRAEICVTMAKTFIKCAEVNVLHYARMIVEQIDCYNEAISLCEKATTLWEA